MYDTRTVRYSVLLLLAAAVTSANSAKCSRLIDGVTAPRSEAEGKFRFYLTLYNRTEQVYAYMPNTRYSVILKCEDSDQIVHRRFRRFLISADAENINETPDIGVFELEDDTMTKFADNCPNTVVETSRIEKKEIAVSWTSPTKASGCVLIRATVVESPDTWYMDDHDLVLNMCPDSKAEADDQGSVLQKCCACDEAKYEVVLEGTWSRNTHPKDFPRGLSIRFSDVIGASHTFDYRFWQTDYNASEGLQQVAELGATRKLESELKSKSNNIRTIIKARGISYPNVTGKTFAVFRVDRDHHLMSLVSMIIPSPDWFIGVAGLELCLPNCSWIMNKQLNLYPYDAGTDSGITYLSPDSPTTPQEPIRRITSTYPNDSASPFFDPAGLDMKPFAKLYLNRQRLYEKTCDSQNKKDPCKDLTPWTDWNACDATCGTGKQLRQRFFVDEKKAINCTNINLTDRRFCHNPHRPFCYTHHGKLLETCDLTAWSLWSSCSATCGQSVRTRSRQFRTEKEHLKYCRLDKVELQQSIDCEVPSCNDSADDNGEVRQPSNRLDDDSEKESVDNSEMAADEYREMIEEWMQECQDERYTEWSLWSPCSSSCGPGVMTRSRLLNDKFRGDSSYKDEECKVQQNTCKAEIESCDFSKEDAEKICSEPKKEGSKRCSSNILRVYFDKQTGHCHRFTYSGCDGNKNNFETEKECIAVCGKFQRELRANQSENMKNFKVSLSSVLSYHIPVQEQRSAKAKRAHDKENFKGIEADSQIIESSTEDKDCELSEWSEWSECKYCRGIAISSRRIVSPAKGRGKSCPKKRQRKKKCNKIMPECSSQRDGTRFRRFHRDKMNETGDEVSVNCKVTPWSTWSRCSETTCDEELQTRVRNVMVQPRGPWAKLCPPLAELRKCPRPEHCPPQ